MKKTFNKIDLPEEMLQKNVTNNAGTNGAAPFGISIANNKSKCINCGKEFLCRRSDAKTCSTKCRVAANRAKKQPILKSSGLSIKERCLLQDICQKVLDNLSWESEAEVYRADYESWICDLSKPEYKLLQKALKKL